MLTTETRVEVLKIIYVMRFGINIIALVISNVSNSSKDLRVYEHHRYTKSIISLN